MIDLVLRVIVAQQQGTAKPRHASAKALHGSCFALHISVCDDGCGFEVPPEGAQVSPEGGFGLFNIYERLKSMDSSMTIESQVGSGTTVTLSFRSTDISY